MAPRKLLMLTYHFPPSASAGSFRLLGFARHLPKFGWQTVVVAPPRLPREPVDDSLLAQLPSGTTLLHVAYPEHIIGRLVRKAFHERTWLPLAAVACWQAIRAHRPHAILTSGPPHSIHLLGSLVHRWTGLSWVADFRDPWVASELSRARRNAAKWETRAESRVMHQASAIVANTPRARAILGDAYPDCSSKFRSITNGYDPDLFQPNSDPARNGSAIEIIHTGTIYADRSPGPFFTAVQHLDHAALAGRKLRVRLIGDFMDIERRKELADFAQPGSNASVMVESQVPHSEAIAAMVRADLLLLLDTPGRRAGVPGKLYEYIGAGRPILALAEPEGEVAWVLKESGVVHRVATPQDPEAIRRALIELLQDSLAIAGRERLPRVHRRFVQEALAGELAALLDSCVERSLLPRRKRQAREVAL
jgi:glycosyltransferase involved in cell wall biosynthesis